MSAAGGAASVGSAGPGLRALALPAALAALVGASALRWGPRVYDDAFITFRYARNLVEGQGFVYNPGERVLGTSAPLWGLVLSGASALTGSRDFPRIALALAALALLAASCLGWLVLRGAGVAAPLAAAGVAAALAAPHTLAVLASGMETPLYLAGVLGAIHLLQRGKDGAAFGVAGLLPFVHPEAALLVPCLAAAAWWRDRRFPLRAALLGSLPALAFAAGLTAYFGSPLPESVRAKALVYPMSPGWALSDMAEAFVGALVPLPRPGALPTVRGLQTLVETLPLALAAALLGATLLRVRRGRMAPAVLALALFSAALYVFFAFVNRPFPWYEPPFVLAAVLAVAAAAGAAGPRLGAAWGVLLLCAAGVHLATLRPYPVEVREEPYRRLMERLRLAPDEVVAAPEIGAVGYYTRARVLDVVGLVSPAALALERERRSGGEGPSDGGVPAALLSRQNPGWLVTLDVFLRNTDPRALDAYEAVASEPATAFGSRAVTAYRRRAAAGPR